MIVYAPRASVVTRAPAGVRRLIVKPGPTVATRRRVAGGFVVGGVGGGNVAVPTANWPFITSTCGSQTKR